MPHPDLQSEQFKLEMQAMETLSDLIQSHQPNEEETAKTLKLLRDTLELPGAGPGMLQGYAQDAVPSLVLPFCRGASPHDAVQHAVAYAEQVRHLLPVLFRDSELYLATVQQNRLIFLLGFRPATRCH